MQVIHSPHPPGSHLYPFADSVQFVRAIGHGTESATVRLHRPAPNVAFGRRDELNQNFETARARVLEKGFQPLVRPVGGHAAAYHAGCLVVDHFEPATDSKTGNLERFSMFAELYLDALETLGISAGVGELPGEYCPGEYSVYGVKNDGSRIKLVGTAQRVVAGAWWFSAGFVVTDTQPLIDVTVAAYDALNLDLDPLTIGGITDINPEVTVEDVEDALLEAYSRYGML